MSEDAPQTNKASAKRDEKGMFVKDNNANPTGRSRKEESITSILKGVAEQ